jgi:hypothetical protein
LRAGPGLAGLDDPGVLGTRGLTDCEGIMSRSGSSPIVALGAGSATPLRWEERAEPAAGPSEGTLDSVAPAGSSMTGSEEREPLPLLMAEPAGSVMTAREPDPQLVQGAATLAREPKTGRID